MHPNRFVPARVVVPIQPVDDPRALFTDVHDRLSGTKGEAAIGAAEELAMLFTALPTALLVAMTRAQTRTTDLAAANLRGSPVPLYIAGRGVLASYPFGPRTGTALNATVMSYCDDLHVGLNIDPAAVTDVKAFMSDVDASFDVFSPSASSYGRTRGPSPSITSTHSANSGSRHCACRQRVARSMT